MGKKTKNNSSNLNDVFKATYADKLTNMIFRNYAGPHTSVEDWMEYSIREEDLKLYPNAVIANQLKASPLANVMREGIEESGVEFKQIGVINPRAFNGLMDLIKKK